MRLSSRVACCNLSRKKRIIRSVVSDAVICPVCTDFYFTDDDDDENKLRSVVTDAIVVECHML